MTNQRGVPLASDIVRNRSDLPFVCFRENLSVNTQSRAGRSKNFFFNMSANMLSCNFLRIQRLCRAKLVNAVTNAYLCVVIFDTTLEWYWYLHILNVNNLNVGCYKDMNRATVQSRAYDYITLYCIVLCISV